MQLFHEESQDADFSATVRAVDWSRAQWALAELTGVALRQVRVDRGFQHALDEAREHATLFGIADDREDVVAHWRDARSWIVPPVMVSGAVLGTSVDLQLLVGFTRLGNLIGCLYRQEVEEVHNHLVWVGTSSEG